MQNLDNMLQVEHELCKADQILFAQMEGHYQSENERIFFETLNIMRSTKTLAHIGICYWMNVTTRKIIANHMIGTC